MTTALEAVRSAKRAKCSTCAHYHKPRSPSLKEDLPLYLVPVIGWLIVAIMYAIPKTPWCSVGDYLADEPEENGPSCAKMRTFGECGADAKLYTPHAKVSA